MAMYKIVHCSPWDKAPEESVVDLTFQGDGVVGVLTWERGSRRWLAEGEIVLMTRVDGREPVRRPRVLRPGVDCVRCPSPGDRVMTSKWGVATVIEVHDSGAAVTAENLLGIRLLMGRMGGWWLYVEPKNPGS